MIFASRMLKGKIHLTEDAVLYITKPKQCAHKCGDAYIAAFVCAYIYNKNIFLM